ncbi:MAG: CCA tRNA nucleotidyltransferase [Candidatus Riflebacteria bacterium]|nr:CCA tRNA nucleotidyltransferase [Candidatus Riflebacteria bacterium]
MLDPVDGLTRLTSDFRLDRLLTVAREARRELYLVGGCLRDLLIGRPVVEVDLATDDDPFDLARRTARRLGGAFVPLDTQFGIARVVVKTRSGGAIQYDLARFKADRFEDDLRRRDFTINALGLAVSDAVAGDLSRLHDPCDGRGDLYRRTVRACYAGAFDDDPLRMLRGFRIAARLGFHIEAGTLALMGPRAFTLDRVAPERITEEVLRILSVSDSASPLCEIRAMGLLDRVFPRDPGQPDRSAPAIPALGSRWGAAPAPAEEACSPGPEEPATGPTSAFPVLSRLEALLGATPPPPAVVVFAEYLEAPTCYGSQTREILKLGALLLDVETGASGGGPSGPADRLSRMRLSAKAQATLEAVVQAGLTAPWRSGEVEPDDLSIYRFFRDQAPHGPGVVLVGLCAEASRQGVRSLETLVRAFAERRATVIDPPRLLDGRAVMELTGMDPGPGVGEILEALREAQVAGRVRALEEATDLVRRLGGSPGGERR